MTLRRITLATTLIPLLTVSAVAQTPSPDERALKGMMQDALARELAATQVAIRFHDQVEALQQQVAADQRRIAELTKPPTADKPTEAPKP